MFHRKLFVSIILAGLIPFAFDISAQMTVTGSITGTVTDPSGQSVPGANVTIRSVNTGDTKSTLTRATFLIDVSQCRAFGPHLCR